MKRPENKNPLVSFRIREFHYNKDCFLRTLVSNTLLSHLHITKHSHFAHMLDQCVDSNEHTVISHGINSSVLLLPTW